jgi:hypothetical protein
MRVMKYRLGAAIVLGALALSGCAELDRERPSNLVDDDAACRAGGAAPGSPDYAACRKDRDIAANRADQRMQNTHQRLTEDMLNGR